MTESEAIKICNTIVFATSFSNPQGVPLNTTKEELTEAIRMSIQALEKQIPKKPKDRYKTRYIWDSAYCPICNCGITARWRYCQCCGQKLDWSDGE